MRTEGHSLLTLAQIEKVREDGLLENHGYSIVGAVDLHSEKLIKIRNPWVSWLGLAMRAMRDTLATVRISTRSCPHVS